MRILHTADWHLDIPTHGRLDPAQGVSTRLVEARDSVTWLADRVAEEPVDLVVIVGDVFDRREVSGPAFAIYKGFIDRMTALGIQVLVVTGNHDMEWHTNRTPMVALAGTSGATTYTDGYIKGGYRFISLPYPSRASLAAMGVSHAEAAERMAELIAHSASVSQDRCIVVGHFTLAGASYNASQNPVLMTGQDFVMPVSALLQTGVDMALMGHIHQQQRVGTSRALYCGSLMTLGYGEENDPPKGALVHDTEAHTVEYWVNPYSPRFVTVDLDATTDFDVPPGAYVRFRSSERVDEAGRKMLQEIADTAGATLTAIIDKPPRVARPGSDSVGKAETDEDILRAYCDVHSIEGADALVALMKEVDAS